MSVAPDLLGRLPEIAAESIREVLPALRDCRAIEGPFDLAELKATSVHTPAVLVGMIDGRIETRLSGPHPLLMVQMAAYVLTRAAPGLPRAVAAAAICSELLRLIPEQTWSTAGVGPATDVRLTPLLSRETRAAGVSFWAVSWRQGLALAARPDAAPLPIELYVAGEELV